MTMSKSFRQPRSLDEFANLDSKGAHVYASPGSQFQPYPFHEKGQEPNSSRITSPNASRSGRSSTADGDYEEEAQRNGSSDEELSKKPRRKLEPADRLVKRRDQNRVSQRAFRQRKEGHIKELQAKVEELENLLEAATHRNNIATYQMGRMEQELSYYRQLLFSDVSQSRMGSSPSSRHISSPQPYTSDYKQSRVSRSNGSALQAIGLTNLTPSRINSPYLSCNSSTLGLNVPNLLPTEIGNTPFGMHQYPAASVDSCSTRNQTPSRSYSPSSESPLPFWPLHSDPSSPIIPVLENFAPAHDYEAPFRLDISASHANDHSGLIMARNRDVPDYFEYKPVEFSDWYGTQTGEQW